MAVLEPKFNLFVLRIVAFDVFFVYGLGVFYVLDVIVDHDVLWLLETHCVVGVVMVYLVLFFLVHALVSKSELLRIFSSKKFVIKHSFPTGLFKMAEIDFVFSEEELFPILWDRLLDYH